MSHTEIAAMLAARWPQLGPWWTQSVTVSYERIRGLREKGQLCTGAFAASKSKTFPVSISRLWAALEDTETRAAWMGQPTRVRTATTRRSMRLDWPDGTRVSLWLTEKGQAKCSVAVQHDKLASAAERAQQKVAWGERLDALKVLLTG